MSEISGLMRTAALVSVLALVGCSSEPPPRRDEGSPPKDPLHGRVRAELRAFASWLEEHGQSGYIGEVGWPGEPGEDVDKWNALADSWFEAADEAGLPVTVWATGEWWTADYRLAVYEDQEVGEGIDSPNAQAEVVERHLDAADGRRGINVAGGEFGAPANEPTASFSNASPGTYGRDYHYDSAATFEYLASRGIEMVRIPFRWERLQPVLGGELNPDELRRLEDVVARASGAGLEVILDMHNYGAFYLDEGGRGVRCPIGSERCPTERFVDVWTRISAAFEDDEGVVGYGLMNEPVGLIATGDLSEADVWHDASQQALAAIREGGDDKIIMVAGYFWASIGQWSKWNPKPWIDDPEDRFLYEAHHYFDRDGSGGYEHTYAQEVAAARDR